ncbi:zinc metalloproteinase nas-36-like [Saccostrea cucullata]|uniref:zinc metalloproteinase nas-36-like n=1 Tax=Saccostrea cuccullata TaxID=36930 RepID=UPI002ECFC152
MMHTIGQTHEQQRTDRDRYIEVYRDKIQSNSYFANFAQKSSYDRTPYDAESILQYSLTSAAVNQGERTMRLKDERLEALVGSSQTFTHSDVKEINLAYKCADHCQNPPNCRNGGFVGSQCDCVCPNGLTGATCEQVISDSGCGGVFNLQTGQQEIIESPNYPNAYSTDTVCLWLIRGPSDSNIRLTLQELDLARNTQQSKCLHWLEVRYNMPGQTGIRLCNTQQQQQQIITTNDGERNILILKFDSRLSRNVQPNQNQRFKLIVETVGGSTSNPCDPNPCLNSGVCSVFGTSFQCKCSQGWSGTVCNIASESCQSNPCLNGGACSMVGNSFSCTCQKGWTGPNCETPESQVTTVPFTTTTSQNSLSRLCDFEDSTCWMQSGNLMIGKVNIVV